MIKVSLAKTLQNGYQPDDRLPSNVDYARRFDMAAATEFGLVPIRNVVQPITNAALSSASIVKSHPWPQLIRAKKLTALLDQDDFFVVSENASSDWSPFPVTVYDWQSYNWDGDSGSSATLTGGKEWHYADLMDTIWMFNGVDTLHYAGFANKTFHQNQVTFATGAAYQDSRLFLGGFETNLHALADWETYMRGLRGDVVPDDIDRLYSATNKQSWIWWSSIGAVDMLRFYSIPFMIYGTLSNNPDTGFDEDNPWWRSIESRRQSGFMPLPGRGQVLKMMQLDKAMVVYMSDGCHLAVPDYSDHSKGFGYAEIQGQAPRLGVKQGTNTRAAAGGNEQVQAAIMENGDLYVLTPTGNGGVKGEYLGYRWAFTEGDDWLVHYDPSEKEFHFSASDRCYRLSQARGFVKAPQIPTTVFFGRSNDTSAPIGIYESDAAAGTVTYRSDYFDDMEGIKVPQAIRLWLESDGYDMSGWSVTVYARRKVTDTLHQNSGTLTPTARGACELKLSGSGGFYVEATHSTPAQAYLKDIIVEFDDGKRRSLASWTQLS